jgi:putative phage-type endonuclease
MNKMNIEFVEQGSEAWKALRLGRVTASRVADIIAKTKSGPAASRGNYMAELICERLTGQAQDGFTNAAMQWGTEQEPNARALYEFMAGVEVAQVGFVHHPAIDMAGASPDGLVGDKGLVEIKCPNSSTHIETLLSEAIPAKYQTQMLWQMATCEREFCDFVSFDPRLPAEMQMFVKKVERDDALIADLEKEVRAFLAELDAKIDALEGKFRRAA